MGDYFKSFLEYFWTPKMHKDCMKRPGWPNILCLGLSLKPELEVGPYSGPYILVGWIVKLKLYRGEALGWVDPLLIQRDKFIWRMWGCSFVSLLLFFCWYLFSYQLLIIILCYWYLLFEYLPCLAGLPSPPLVSSGELSASRSSYLLAWRTDSFTDILQYNVLYRKLPVSKPKTDLCPNFLQKLKMSLA